ELAVVSNSIGCKKKIRPNVLHIENFEQQIATGNVNSIQTGLYISDETVHNVFPQNLLGVGKLDVCIIEMLKRFAARNLRDEICQQSCADTFYEIPLAP